MLSVHDGAFKQLMILLLSPTELSFKTMYLLKPYHPYKSWNVHNKTFIFYSSTIRANMIGCRRAEHVREAFSEGFIVHSVFLILLVLGAG